MYACGKSRDEIAIALFISPRTVDTHVKQARRRLGARTICHAVAILVAHGYIAVDGRRQELYIPAPLDEPSPLSLETGCDLDSTRIVLVG